MGNEQSGGGGGGSGSAGGPPGPSTSASTFSFLSKGSVKRGKGIVVVKDGREIQEPDWREDDDYKRLLEIPRFLPILRSSVAGGRADPTDSHHRLSHRPVWRLANRLQQHLKVTAQTVASEQGLLGAAVSQVDAVCSEQLQRAGERKRQFDRLSHALASLTQLNDDVIRIQLMLEELVPALETLNEVLPPEHRAEPLNMKEVLERSPPTSSGSSAGPSLPSSLPSSLPPSLPASQHGTPRRHLRPVEETTVLDLGR